MHESLMPLYTLPGSLRFNPVTATAIAGVLMAGSVLTSTAHAQNGNAPKPLHFVYLRGADTLGTESVTIEAGTVAGVLTMRGQPSITWSQQRRGPSLLALHIVVRAPNAANTSPPVQDVTLTPAGDSVLIEAQSGGQSRGQHVASQAGAIPFLGQSVAHAAIVSRAAREAGRRVVPLFMSAGAQTMQGTVTGAGDTTTLAISGLSLRTVWGSDGPVEITVPAQGLRVVRVATPIAPPSAETVSYGAPVGAPYSAEQVTIPTARGYTLAGTLTTPSNRAGRVPVVITISGSGPQERDSRLPGIRGYQVFREIADTLGRRGIAVLRYDDRGVGMSGGASTRNAATSADFADDVQSVIAWLKTRPDIDPTRIALAGHSEGGLIAPLVAVRDPSVRAIALLAGPAYDGRRILAYQNETVIRELSDVTSDQRDSLRRKVQPGLDSLERSNPWFSYFMRTDPRLVLAQVKQPVLVLQGDTDLQVTREQADTIAATLRRSGNSQVALHHFPATNHLMIADSSGALSGYMLLANTRVRREVLGVLADWMVRTLR